MYGLGTTELIIILAILLLLFGPSRLGSLGSALGKGIKGFRKSVKDDEIDVTPTDKEEQDVVKDTGREGFKSAQRSENSEVS